MYFRIMRVLLAVSSIFLISARIAISASLEQNNVICRYYDKSKGDVAIQTDLCTYQGYKDKMTYVVSGRQFVIQRNKRIDSKDELSTVFNATLNNKKALLEDQTAYAFSVVTDDKALQFEVVAEESFDGVPYLGVWSNDYPNGCKKQGGEYLEGTTVISHKTLKEYESNCKIIGATRNADGLIFLRLDCVREMGEKIKTVYTFKMSSGPDAQINGSAYRKCNM